MSDAELIRTLQAENERLRGEMPPCDGYCNEWGGPQEDCSRHGRPVAQVWQMLSDENARHRLLRDKIATLTEEWRQSAEAGEDERYGRIIGRTLKQCADEVQELVAEQTWPAPGEEGP